MRLNKGLLNASQNRGNRLNNILDITLGNERDETFITYENYTNAIGVGGIITFNGKVKGNLIEVKSTNLNSSPNNGGYIKVNGSTITSDTVNMSRGHTLVVIDTLGNIISINTYDTYGDINLNCELLSSNLTSVTIGYIAIIATWDATGVNSNLRNTLRNSYGATSNVTWSTNRESHIFVGIRK
jgi:hypothetical protein